MMALDDFLESEVVVAVAATAAACSPPVRRVLRRGAVYGIAGAIMAGDAVSSFARGAARGMKEAADSASETVDRASEEGRASTGGEA